VSPKRSARSSGSDHECRPAIDAGGLPNRDGPLLARDERLWPHQARALSDGLATGGRGGVKKGGSVPAITVGQIEAGFESDDRRSVAAAAFLAGRSRTDDDDDRERFRTWAAAFVDRLDPSNLRTSAGAYIEAAMSLALLGDGDRARTALQAVVTGARSTRGYLAAYYLAQLGDPSGWPAMVADLHSDSEHTRLMAVRHLLAFRAFDGTTVGDEIIDLRARFAEAANDSETYVTNEVPGLLEEAGLER
jgi:hypothetical protein